MMRITTVKESSIESLNGGAMDNYDFVIEKFFLKNLFIFLHLLHLQPSLPAA